MVPGCLCGQGCLRLWGARVQVPDPGRDQNSVGGSGNLIKTPLLLSELPAARGQVRSDLGSSSVKRSLLCLGVTVCGVSALGLSVQRRELISDDGRFGAERVTLRG